MLKTYSQDLSNLDERKLPDVIDLFSGCGGLALGFYSLGFEIAAGIDIDADAAMTASVNFHWQNGFDTSSHTQGNVRDFDMSCFLSTKKSNGYIVIGGPPCQAYSQAGRGKLRSLGNDRIHTNDTRGYLYKDLLEKALALDARCVVVENVPESINFGHLNIPEEICFELSQNGYLARWSILNAADYGVPQFRERVIVIAWKESERIFPEFPIPTHRSGNYIIPTKKKNKKLKLSSYYIESPEASNSAEAWLNVKDAISDLPSLFKTSGSKYRLIDNDVLLDYRTDPQNEYQKLMRNWPNLRSHSNVTGHGFRKTIRDFPIFECMMPGDNFVEASIIADQLFDKKLAEEGITYENNLERYNYLKKITVPPYDRDKFHDKWRKLDPNRPSHTLVAHLGIDTYSHIHPWEPRGISIREAARLQSFPDSFIFPGNMGAAFKQIGNAVPPLLSRAIALKIAEQIKERDK